MACRKCITMRDEVCNVIVGVLPLRVVYWCMVRVAMYLKQQGRGADNISLDEAMRITRFRLEGMVAKDRKDLT